MSTTTNSVKCQSSVNRWTGDVLIMWMDWKGVWER